MNGREWKQIYSVYSVCYVMCERVNFKQRTWGYRLFPNSGFGTQIPINTLDHQILISISIVWHVNERKYIGNKKNCL